MSMPRPIQKSALAFKQHLRVLRRRIFEFVGNPACTPKTSLGGLDEKLEKYLNYRGGVFIEAGANDGISQSNTYYLEHGRRWRGILVEAIPELYLKCKAQRRARTFNRALVASDYPAATVRMHFANLMSVAEGVLTAGELREHLELGFECQNLKGPYEVDVPAATLASLIEECGLDRIDFLSLDVEGGEAAVLEGLDLRKNRPRYILVEARFFDEVHALLTSHQYVMLEQMSHHDFLYGDGLHPETKVHLLHERQDL